MQVDPDGVTVQRSASLAEFLTSLTWGGPQYPAYSGKCEVAADAGAGAPSGGSAASPSAASPSASPAASPAAGAAPSSASPAGTPAPEGGAVTGPDWKTAPEHFRKAYDDLKAQHERFATFKDVDPESLTTAHTTHQRMYDESLTLAEELGYADDETVAAFHQDPVKLLSFLRAKKAEADAGTSGAEGDGKGGQPDQQKTLEQMLNQRLKPFEQLRAKQMADSANQLFRTTVTDLIAADYKGEDALPAELQTVLTNMVSDRLKADPKAIYRLVNEGKVSDLQKMYSEAKTALLDVYGKMAAYDKARLERAAKSKPGARPAGDRKPNASSNGGNDDQHHQTGGRPRNKFDEVADRLITQPEKVNQKYGQR